MMTHAQQAVEEIAADQRSGATTLAERGAAILAAAASQPGDDLRATALALAHAQPAMAPLLRLANTVLLAADAHPDTYSEAARLAAQSFADALRAHSSSAARAGAALPFGACVLVHSASSLVAEALLQARAAGRQFTVVCTESRPALEGVALAAHLGDCGIPTRLIADAAAPAVLAHCDALLVGADTLCGAGLLHKAGTLGLALAARHHGVPAYSLATEEKLLPAACGARPPIPARDPAELLPAPAPAVRALNFYFDLTPYSYLTGIITEQGQQTVESITQRLHALPLHPALRGIWEAITPDDPLLP